MKSNGPEGDRHSLQSEEIMALNALCGLSMCATLQVDYFLRTSQRSHGCPDIQHQNGGRRFDRKNRVAPV